MESISPDEVSELDDPLLIDVRSPGEYEEDHLSGAVNLPVLNNEQRDEVGTLYNQSSTFKARQVGARTIAENLPAILETIEERASRNRPVVVYCWRGGMRSESLGVVLERIGYPTYRIEGGYKSYRGRVHEFFQERQWDQRFISIYSLTGCGKTRLLKILRSRDHSIVDLEGAANHRGSAFGSVGLGKQPSQKAFENRLFQQIRAGESPVFIEGESRHVGSLRIPDSLFDEVTEAPRVWLEADLDRRVEIIFDEYQWPEAREELIDHIDNLRERLGHDRVDRLQENLREDNVRTVIRRLLESYYDPAYENSCPPKEEFDLVLDGNDLEQTADQLIEWSRETVTG